MEHFDFDTPVQRHGTDSVKWDSYPDREVLPLWVADMDFRTAPAIIEALEQRAAHGIFGYTHPGHDYFAAIDSWFTRRHGWHIEAGHVIYTTGVVPATSAVIKGLAAPGTGVVVMTPVYTCFFSSIRNNGCRVEASPLVMNVDGYYEIDFDDLETKLAQPDNTLLLLCNPHNPGGRVWTADELRRVDSLCARHGVTVLSDEIHCDICMPGYSYTPYANVATAPWVAMVSPSKAFNTAGLQVANIVCPSDDMRARIDRAININETCDVGPFGVVALVAAYNHGEQWLKAMNEYVADNYRYLRETLASCPLVKVMPLQGTYLAWVDVKALGKPVAGLCERLRADNKVWFHPGTAYGEDGEGYIRINLATSRQTLAEALRRFVNAISTESAPR